MNPTIQALAAASAQGELQNVQVHRTAAPLRVDHDKMGAAVLRAVNYKIGDGREDLLEIEEAVRQSQYHDGDRETVTKLLAGMVTGTAVTSSQDLKVFACRQLWTIGTQAAVGELAAALKDPVLSDMARYALQNMEYPEVDKVLIAALDGTPSSVQIGVINSLAMRKSEDAIEAIKPLKKSKDKGVAEAAKHAIGRLEGKIVP